MACGRTSPSDLPVAEQPADQICSLPLFPAITEDEHDPVIDAVREFGASWLGS